MLQDEEDEFHMLFGGICAEKLLYQREISL